MFILVDNDKFYNTSRDIYAGKTYIVHGGCYPTITDTLDEAKKYTTKAKAENACEKLNIKVGRNFVVEEINTK